MRCGYIQFNVSYNKEEKLQAWLGKLCRNFKEI